VYTVYHKSSFSNNSVQDSHLYSIMRTLFDTFNKATFRLFLLIPSHQLFYFERYYQKNSPGFNCFYIHLISWKTTFIEKFLYILIQI